MEAKRLSCVGALEELGPCDASGAEIARLALDVALDPLRVSPKPPHAVREVDPDDEVVVARAPLTLPPGQRSGDVRRQRPGARVVRLVLVEPDATVLEVEVAEVEAGELREPHALADEDPVGEAALEGDGAAREELRVLRGVEARLRLVRALRDLRHPLARNRVRGEVAAWVDGEREHAANALRDELPRAGREVIGELRHHPLDVREADRGDGLVPDLRVDVEPEHLLVALRVLLADVVWEAAVKPAARPLLGERAERHQRALFELRGRTRAKQVHRGEDRFPRATGPRLRRHLEELLRLARVAGRAEPLRHDRHRGAPLARADLVVGECGEREAASGLLVDPDPGFPADGELPELAELLRGRGHRWFLSRFRSCSFRSASGSRCGGGRTKTGSPRSHAPQPITSSS